MITLNEQVIEFKRFPNGEANIDVEQIRLSMFVYQANKINLKYEDDSDLIKLMFLKNYLDEWGCQETYLNILYMPYSRMDRVEGNSVFTLKYVTQFINNLFFNGVVVHEPHSDVTPALINYCQVILPTVVLLPRVLEEIGFDKKIDYLFFPDAGAQKRYHNLKGYKTLVGHKDRDFQTGRINSLKVVGDIENQAKVLILDDLCSYGGTFMLSASSLLNEGAGEVYLFIAHCENSIHKGKILETDLIKKVFTTDSILTEPHDKIHVYTIE